MSLFIGHQNCSFLHFYVLFLHYLVYLPYLMSFCANLFYHDIKTTHKEEFRIFQGQVCIVFGQMGKKWIKSAESSGHELQFKKKNRHKSSKGFLSSHWADEVPKLQSLEVKYLYSCWDCPNCLIFHSQLPLHMTFKVYGQPESFPPWSHSIKCKSSHFCR